MRHSFFFAWPLVGRLAAPGVGLDWADDGLRLVQLSADGALVQAQLAWPSTCVPLDGAGVQLLAESLQQLWQQAGVRQRRVRAALPESMLQRRSLRLPAGLDEAELEALVQAEWQRQAGADAHLQQRRRRQPAHRIAHAAPPALQHGAEQQVVKPGVMVVGALDVLARDGAHDRADSSQRRRGDSAGRSVAGGVPTAKKHQ